jgi:putative redox protein
MAKVQFKATSVTDGTVSTIMTGGHQLIIDEPVSLGGKNLGANPLSVLLAALLGCENVIARRVAKDINFDLQGLSFSAKGVLDPAGSMGDSNVRSYYEKVEITVDVKTTESEERVQQLHQLTDARCPVFNTLKAADVEMVTNWKKVQ